MQWREIKNTDGKYLISDDGKVFSAISNRILKTQISNVGYERIELCFTDRTRKEFVHRLVAEAFIPNPNNYPVVNHKDENPLNNRVENLEWCTYKYNTNYGNCLIKMSKNHNYKSGADNVKSKRVFQFTLNGELVAEYGSTYEAQRKTGMNSKSIAKACTGILKQYAGYLWSYNPCVDEYSEKRNTNFRKGNIAMCDLEGNVIKVYSTPRELEADGFNQMSVNRVCRGERKSYKGYVFKHIDE